MLHDYSSAAYEDMCNDIKESILFLPIDCFVNDLEYHGIKTVCVVVMPDVNNDVSISYLAEYLRMHKRSSKEVKAVYTKTCDLSSLYQLGIENLECFEEYIEKLSGEMAFQEAFPRKAPNWALYHIDENARQ